ncbi:MAG TPA: prepilin-type N-terminal cleavage/methylation domain-containing protein [Planctomycetota bacterium]|nr:prepilin-type N-terminal cleavage/methylation domain-containing protein [Planctomycetota bacterium]
MPPSTSLPPPRAGFSLLELVAVVAILALLAGALVPALGQRMAGTRDARRLHDLHVLRDAIEQYRLDKGVWPAADPVGVAGGWDASYDGEFIPALTSEGYLAEPVHDPLDTQRYHYRYHVYNRGRYGCVGPDDFYVLGIRNFETAEFAAQHPGHFKCSGRDWGLEFAYVTGGGASAE